MKKARWLLLVGVLLLLTAGVVWWMSTHLGIRLIFVRYHEENGERFAVLRLENDSSSDIIYPGAPGSPLTHFHTIYPGGEAMGAGWRSRPRGGNSLKSGESVEFHARLHLPLHQREVAPPFRAGVKFLTPFRTKSWISMEALGVPQRFRPSIEEIIWTDFIEK